MQVTKSSNIEYGQENLYKTGLGHFTNLENFYIQRALQTPLKIILRILELEIVGNILSIWFMHERGPQ